jgi:ACS family tartrate transporter-like MFS transporter
VNVGFAALALFVAGATTSIIMTLLALTVATSAVYITLSPFWIFPPGFLVGTAAASGMALINAFGNLGGAAGPMLMGFLCENSGGYGLGMNALAFGLVLAAILVVGLKRFLPADHGTPGVK